MLFCISICFICTLTVEGNYEAVSYIYLQFLTLSSSLNILEAKHELVDRFTWNPIIPLEEVE